MDQRRPRITKSTINVIDQQGIDGTWTTAGQKDIIRIVNENVGPIVGMDQEIAEMLSRKIVT